MKKNKIRVIAGITSILLASAVVAYDNVESSKSDHFVGNGAEGANFPPDRSALDEFILLILNEEKEEAEEKKQA